MQGLFAVALSDGATERRSDGATERRSDGINFRAAQGRAGAHSGQFWVLRFRDEKGADFPAWEEKQFAEVAPLQRGFDLPVDEIEEGNYPVVFSNGILKTHRVYKAEAPGVVTGRSGTIGKVTYVAENYWPHNTSLWVTNFKGNHPKYIFYLLQNMRLEKFSTGSGVPTLNRNDIHSQKIKTPSPIEQQKIAAFLSVVDKETENLKQQLESTRHYKKAVLQQLFSA